MVHHAFAAFVSLSVLNDEAVEFIQMAYLWSWPNPLSFISFLAPSRFLFSICRFLSQIEGVREREMEFSLLRLPLLLLIPI